MFETTLKAGREILLSGNEKIINQEGVWRMRIPPNSLLKLLYERHIFRTTQRTVIKYNTGLHFSMHIEERSITIGQHKESLNKDKHTIHL